MLEGCGKGLNHLCFTVVDIERTLVEYQRRGIGPGHVTPDGIIQMPAQRMVYLDPEQTYGILIELVEPNSISAADGQALRSA